MTNDLEVAALRLSESRYRRFLEEGSEGMALIDETGLVIDWNRALEAMTGVSKAEALGQAFEVVQLRLAPSALRKPESLARQREIVGEALRTGNSVFLNRQIEADYQRADGTLRHVQQLVFAIPSSRGYQLGLLSRDITEKKKADERIEKLLEEKDALLREVHHRIKNNMGTVVGLFTLQAMGLKDPAAIRALEDASSRVQSMMVLYDKLYHAPDFTQVVMRQFLPSLVTEILENFPNCHEIAVTTEVDDLILPPDQAQPLAIIVNELLTNAMKYAFPGQCEGRLLVSLKRVGSGLQLAVHDSGPGLPEGFDPESSTGFGMMLLSLMTRQLHGTLRLESTNGTRVEVTIPG